jgi:hypothetical protein
MKHHAQRAASGNRQAYPPPGARTIYSLLLNPVHVPPSNATVSIPTDTIVTIETLPIFMAIADSMPHASTAGSWMMDPCSSVLLDRFFITLLPLIFLVTVLRSSMLFTSQASRVHDTQNIHVAHSHSGTESSLPSQQESY